MSVLLEDGTQRIPQLMMPHSTRMMSPEESTEIFHRATPSIPTSQGMCLSPRALPPLRRLHKDKKKKLSIGMSFPKKGGVSLSQHTCEACGQPLPPKKPLMLRRNSNILLLLLNFHYNCIMYFNCSAYIGIRIYTYP